MENWRDKKILVAEDEVGNFFLIACLLEDTGINITHADNGKKAVELCAAEHFDLILMDIKMPVMDGFEAIAEIKRFNKEITIIAQTAYAYKREECIELGFTDYLPKPFNEEQIITMLSKYIQTS